MTEKILAVGDSLISAEMMRQGLSDLETVAELKVTSWQHPSIEELQAANRQVEEQGPEGIDLPVALQTEISQASLLIVQFTPINRQLIEKSPKLKAIFVLRAGVENIDLVAAKERQIEVVNLSGRNARAVAEFTVGLILAEIKNIGRSHNELQAGKWRKGFPNEGQIIELKERKIGLIGFGKIGFLVTELLSGFSCQFLVYDPYVKQADLPRGRVVSLEELLVNSDVVSLHARSTPETYQLMNQNRFDLMKPTAYFINTARSHLVDEEALIETLTAKKIMGAALDVFDNEPLAKEHPLLQLDNVTLTPHIAGTTVDAFGGSPGLMVPKVKAWLLKANNR